MYQNKMYTVYQLVCVQLYVYLQVLYIYQISFANDTKRDGSAEIGGGGGGGGDDDDGDDYSCIHTTTTVGCGYATEHSHWFT